MLPQAPFHTCAIVADIESAMRTVGAAWGLTWSPVQEYDYYGGIKVVYAQGPAPYVELLQGTAASPWHTPDQAVLHHLGYWSEDVRADIARLEKLGFEPEMATDTAAYLVHPSSPRVELVATSSVPELSRMYGVDFATSVPPPR